MGELIFYALAIFAIIVLAFILLIIKWYKKPIHGRALVRTGKGGTKIVFEYGIFVIPVLHRIEIMDITVKTVTISRTGIDGLICKDNLRADIKVAFFVRVNNTTDDAKKVALSIGCERASHNETLISLFDAKFSEALKTVGKKFDFVDLYTERDKFKHEILKVIGTDLNGYVLDDCAIDYLEQTSIETLKKSNILDAEGIKKITELTANQLILANKIENEREKTITKQNVEAREAILEMQRQLAETEERQKREVANIKDREYAEIRKVAEEQRLVAEQARIQAEESLQIQEENKQRAVIVAKRNKERTDAVEIEKVTKDRDLEINERERIVTLAQIEKEKAVEEEKKNIQEVIRERVAVERDVVTEEEKIKDTREFATAERAKKVAITNAEMIAEQGLVKQIKAAEAERQAAEFISQRKIIEADTNLKASEKEAESQKILAEAKAAQEAAIGIAEAQVIEAKALASKKQGETDAFIIESKSVAESRGMLAKATAEAEGKEKIGLTEANIIKQKGISEALIIKEKGTSEAFVVEQKGNADAGIVEKRGMAEAKVQEQKGLAEATVIREKAASEKEKGLAEANIIEEKLKAEAKGIHEKAEAMKKLDSVGKEHEEFKLQLQKEKEVELAQINIQKDIAAAQASVISAALKSAKIDIVGGETMFFEKIIGSISNGKALDSFVQSSSLLTSLKNKYLPSKQNIVEEKDLQVENIQFPEPETVHNNAVEEQINTQQPVIQKDTIIDNFHKKNFKEQLKELLAKFHFSKKELENSTISDLLSKMIDKALDEQTKTMVAELVETALQKGFDKLPLRSIGIK